MYIRHESGATHDLKGRAFSKLRSEVLAGRGGPETAALIEQGYHSFNADDGADYSLDALTAVVFGGHDEGAKAR